MSAYIDREQTQAKHFILRGYLQELAYKVLRSWDIAMSTASLGRGNPRLPTSRTPRS